MNLQNQIIALWIVVLLIIGYILFLQQKRSYFVPGTQTPITMMDLQEYSYIDQAQRTTYIDQLTNRSPMLTMSKTNMMAYQSNLNAIMESAFNTPTTNTNVSQITQNVVPTLIPTPPPTGPFTISVNNLYLSQPNNTLNTLTGSTTKRDTFTVDSRGLRHIPSGKYVSALLTLGTSPVAFTYFRGSQDPSGTYRVQKPGTGFLSFNGSNILTFTSA